LPEKLIKRVFIFGDPFVGKTAILRALQGLNIEELFGTMGVDLCTLTFLVGDEEVMFNIWDLSGNRKFHDLNLLFFKKHPFDGGFLVFDLTSRRSFTNISYFMELAKKASPGRPVILLGNKRDLERVVSKEEALSFAQEHDFPYFETSAATKENLTEAFVTFGKILLEKQ